MSNTRAIIDYAMDDNGKELRSALYAEIHDKVMSHIEAKKIELAGGMVTQEEVSNESDAIIEEMEKTERKISKLKEQIAILETSECEMSDDDDDDDDDSDKKDKKIDKKKKKLQKKEKKLAKLKESFALLESGGVGEDGDWEESEEEDEEESE